MSLFDCRARRASHTLAVLVLLAGFVPPHAAARNGIGRSAAPGSSSSEGTFVLRNRAGGVTCDDATPAEVGSVARRDPALAVREIERPSSEKGSFGLKIVLRGTAQLDNYPAAKAAFIR